MTSVTFWSAVILSWDSFVAGAIVGPFLRGWRASVALAFLFALCDGGAAVIGDAWPHAAPTPPEILIYFVAAPLIAIAATHSRRWLFLTPALLSVDNLASGLLGANPLVLALGSGVAAIVGLTLSRCFARGAYRSVRLLLEA